MRINIVVSWPIFFLKSHYSETSVTGQWLWLGQWVNLA